MARDLHDTPWMEQPSGSGSERCGDLLRHVVLPAGNLRVALADHVAAHRSGLDETTLTLLKATAEVLEEISLKGRALASDAANS